MADRSIASRPSLEQVVAIVDYMEKHPPLALGQLRGLEGREESKKLWLGLTRIVNGITGPTRPMKSWIKYWADKKSSVRSKVLSAGGDPDNLCSNLEKKIWDLFLAEDQGKQHGRSRNVKVEAQIPEEPFLNEDGRDHDVPEVEDNTEEIEFEEPPLNYEQRQVNLMEKLVKVMSAQAAAMTQIARATQLNSQAMGRLADSALLQARAVERLSASLESIGASSVGVGAAVADIDNTMKRFYTNHT